MAWAQGGKDTCTQVAGCSHGLCWVSGHPRGYNAQSSMLVLQHNDLGDDHSQEAGRRQNHLVEAEDLHTAIQEQGGGAVEAMLAERLAKAEEAVRAKDKELDEKAKVEALALGALCHVTHMPSYPV